jgi:AcrR family transcriptional regulator
MVQAAKARKAPQAKSARGQNRRDMILAAAARLFHHNGFHDTGIDDIGAAVGITGPGVYRHFDSKQDLLGAIVEQSLARHQEIVDEVKGSGLAPRDALAKLVDMSADALVANRDQGAIYSREAGNLDDEKHARFIRAQRALIADWVELLQAARPEMSEEEARVEVRAVSGLLNSVGVFTTSMPQEKLASRLSEMALRALLPQTR